MAISTATTTLNYGVKQIETATVVGTIGTAGNATVIVTAVGVTGTPVTFSVAVLSGDNAITVATKIITALKLNASLVSKYSIEQSGASIIMTSVSALANDATLNISINNGTCTGLTPALTSTNTLAGIAFSKLVDIVNYPDMGATPSKLDTTDLSASKYKTSILGLQDIPDLTFECNYDKTAYNLIQAMLGGYTFKLELGASGVDGIFIWDGQISIFASGAGVDEVRKMTITLSAKGELAFS